MGLGSRWNSATTQPKIRVLSPTRIKAILGFIVTQQDKSQDDNIVWFTELVYEATFKNNKMQCTRLPLILLITSTVSTHCDGDLEYIFYLTIGPNDARVF